LAEFDFGRFEVLTFDCYGTLIDWEAGIASALRVALGTAVSQVDDEELLTRYARHEAAAESGTYLSYRAILAQTAAVLAAELDVPLGNQAAAQFGDSVGDWPAFPDSAGALDRLHERFRLGVITNCDDDLFAASNEKLGVEFDSVITAEQARGYKPRTENFEFAFARIDVPRERILHVAQSLFHDHVPAKALGMTTVWVDRRQGRPGTGATPPAEATPDLTLGDLRSFAELATGQEA
jgi:2-haloacid dehalogenase